MLVTLPAPSSVTSITSPGATTLAPAGVPVRITSPGSSVMNRDRSATICAKVKIRSAPVVSWRTSPLTVLTRCSVPGSTPCAGIAGPIGVKPSWPLAITLEPRSAQRKSCRPKSLAGA